MLTAWDRRILRTCFAIACACVGAELVAIPAAIVWGSSGPTWPFIPLGILAAAGAIVGWKLEGNL